MNFFLGLASKKFVEAFSAIFPNIFLNTHFRAKYIRINKFLNIFLKLSISIIFFVGISDKKLVTAC